MKKIIFLDFDGVMDTAYYDHYLNYMGMPACDEYGPVFDPECVEALRKIIQQTNAEIVVSSTWKDEMTLEELQTMWTARQLPGRIVSATPSLGHRYHRGDEIDAWLDEHSDADCRYVIIDDMDATEFNDEQIQCLLTVNPYNGLDDDSARRAAGILSQA